MAVRCDTYPAARPTISVMLAFMLPANCHANAARPSRAGARRTGFIMRAVGRNILRAREGCILNVVGETIEVVPRANVCSRIGDGE